MITYPVEFVSGARKNWLRVSKWLKHAVSREDAIYEDQVCNLQSLNQAPNMNMIIWYEGSIFDVQQACLICIDGQMCNNCNDMYIGTTQGRPHCKICMWFIKAGVS